MIPPILGVGLHIVLVCSPDSVNDDSIYMMIMKDFIYKKMIIIVVIMIRMIMITYDDDDDNDDDIVIVKIHEHQYDDYNGL